MSGNKTLTLDIRPLLAQGQEPFAQIMNAVESLEAPGDQLVLTAPFEPAPLYRVMERQGFDHETEPLPDGGFQVRFTRR